MIAASVVMMASMNANADPVSLKCFFPEDISFDVTLNQTANTAAMRASAGGILNVSEVAFNPSEVNIVVWTSIGGGSARLFDIDRTTLEIEQNITFLPANIGVVRGQCELVEVPVGRKF